MDGLATWLAIAALTGVTPRPAVTNVLSASYQVWYWVGSAPPLWPEVQTNSDWSAEGTVTNVVGGTNAALGTVTWTWPAWHPKTSPAEQYVFRWSYQGKTNVAPVGMATSYVVVLNPPVTNVWWVRPQVSTNLVDWRTNGVAWAFTNVTTAGQPDDVFWRLVVSTN